MLTSESGPRLGNWSRPVMPTAHAVASGSTLNKLGTSTTPMTVTAIKGLRIAAATAEQERTKRTLAAGDGANRDAGCCDFLSQPIAGP